MDLMKAEKLQALNKSHNQNKTFFSYNLIIHCLIAFLCMLCFYTENWFPSSLYTCLKQFMLVVSLSNKFSFLVQPKCLFVVANVIVVFLVGESRGVVGSCSSPTPEIYEEYMQRIQNLRGHDSIIIETQEEEGLVTKRTEENLEALKYEQVKHLEKQVETEVEDDARDGEEEEEEEEDGGGGLPAEELNKRVEKFIAKINRQRRIEARQVELEYSKAQ